uniref:tumor necrosis factor receptor superfamily member 4 n=1 Tax=Scatophagus argus TaxID=75038 RepID=UPI001ED80B0D|nr:tumor necrosis factor receptor superfamily member 4 [Scatophagus argus]
MFLLSLLVITLTFNELIVSLNAACPKGQRVGLNGKAARCEPCSNGTYQPELNESQRCRVCTTCDPSSGSVTKQKCTKETNTKCECRGEFVPWDDDSSTCKCDVGFGLDHGECSKCKDGYFSTTINSSCKKWKECKSTGVKINGTRISDVICNEVSESNIDTTTIPTNKIVSLSTLLTSHRPHEGAQTQKKSTTITTTTTTTTTTTSSVQRHTISPEIKGEPTLSNTGNHIVLVLLIFGIAGLLVLTAVTCKLQIIPRVEKHPGIKKNESLCRKPVEESGDGSLSSLKLNPGEP